jgi:hypothetical protein
LDCCNCVIPVVPCIGWPIPYLQKKEDENINTNDQ